MTDDLSALIARLEAAEVGSRELGRDVLVAMNLVREVGPTLFYGVGNEDTWHFGDNAEEDGRYSILPDPSSSLDAALALAERVLGEARALDLLQDVVALNEADGLAIRDLPRMLCSFVLRAKQGEG